MRLPLLTSIAFVVACAQALAQSALATQLNTRQLKPAIFYWDFGTIETIYPSEDSLGTYWNVVHRTSEPVKPYDDYDYYKVDAKTLRPITSEMYHRGFIDYRIDFEPLAARIEIANDNDTTRYRVDLDTQPAPEGPGSPLFWGSLPLKVGYTMEYRELDRWAGKDRQLAVVVTKNLRVVGTETLRVDNQKVPAYQVEITSDKGSSMTVWVMKQAPHYWLQVNYRPTPDRERKSRVTRFFLLGS